MFYRLVSARTPFLLSFWRFSRLPETWSSSIVEIRLWTSHVLQNSLRFLWHEWYLARSVEDMILYQPLIITNTRSALVNNLCIWSKPVLRTAIKTTSLVCVYVKNCVSSWFWTSRRHWSSTLGCFGSAHRSFGSRLSQWVFAKLPIDDLIFGLFSHDSFSRFSTLASGTDARIPCMALATLQLLWLRPGYTLFADLTCTQLWLIVYIGSTAVNLFLW